MTLPTYQNTSFLAQQVNPQNFCVQFSASLAVSGTSASVTFPVTSGTLRQTFQITNRGSHGAYLGWGTGSATAVVSSGTPTAHCHYIGAGCILVLDFQLSTGIVNTIAAIQDTGSTTLEISIGSGQ